MKNKRKIVSIMVCVMLLMMAPYGSKAQTRYGIAAMVNDEAITSVALKERLKLAIVSSGLPATAEVQSKLLPQIIQLLIDEALLEQEASSRGISVASSEMAGAMASIAAKNNIEAEQLSDFFVSQNVSELAVRAQVRAQIIKTRLTARAVKPEISVTAQEIEEKMENIASQAGKEEFHLSEIVLPVETPEDEDKIKKLAERLHQELQVGSDFSLVAKEFSRSSTAEQSGELGWVVEDAISNVLRTEVSSLKSGEVSQPLRLAEGYHILRLNDRRAIVTSDENETEIGLRQLFLPVASEASESAKAKAFERLQLSRAGLQGCSNFENIAAELGSTASAEMVMTQLKDVKAEMRQLLAPLTVGTPSSIVNSGEGLHVFIICERIQAADSVVQPERVRAMLEQQEMGLYFRRFIQKLRRDAFIEIRI